MFYSELAIQALENRVGWAIPVQPAPASIALSAYNMRSESGLNFKGFHKMATVEKVFNLIDNPTITTESFQAQLNEIRRQSVIKVLKAVYDRNTIANYYEDYNGRFIDRSGTDYSNVIITRANVFDNAIGYQVAYDVIELQVSSARSNLTERAAAEAYTKLKIELDGIQDGNDGNFNSKGITFKLNQAIKEAIEILFPNRGKRKGLVNASFKW